MQKPEFPGTEEQGSFPVEITLSSLVGETELKRTYSFTVEIMAPSESDETTTAQADTGNSTSTETVDNTTATGENV